MERRGRGRPPKVKRIVQEDDEEMPSDQTVSEQSDDESEKYQKPIKNRKQRDIAMKSESDENEEDFYKKLEEEAKEGKVDLEKMTRRQRMTYLAT